MFILLYNTDTKLFGFLTHPLASCSLGLRDFTSRAESTFPSSAWTLAALPVQPIRIILQLKELLGEGLCLGALESGSHLRKGWAKFPYQELTYPG